MAIIRRNPDGSVQSDSRDQQPTQSHPALMTRTGVKALSESGRALPMLMDEIATKINNAKDKTRKLKVLKENDSVALRQVPKRLYLFTKGGDSTLSSLKRETIFIQMLEGLSAGEAEFLVTVVNKKVNNKYKGFTANLVKEAFDWDDNFMKKEG